MVVRGSAPLRHAMPAWSSKGTIVYRDNGITNIGLDFSYTVDSTKAGLWIIPAGGGAAYRFLSEGRDPAWSPSGDTLAVAQANCIELYNAATGLRLVEIATGESPRYLGWSRDGRYLLWHHAYDHPGVYCAGSPSFTGSMLAEHGSFPEWDPVTGAVLYLLADGRSGTTVLLEVAPGSAHTDTLCTLSGALREERLSPGGSTIAFSAPGAVAGRWELHSVWRTGAGRRQLTSLGGSMPAWSPDGSALLFVREDPASASSGANVIWKLDLSSMSETQLTSPW